MLESLLSGLSDSGLFVRLLALLWLPTRDFPSINKNTVKLALHVDTLYLISGQLAKVP